MSDCAYCGHCYSAHHEINSSRKTRCHIVRVHDDDIEARCPCRKFVEKKKEEITSPTNEPKTAEQFVMEAFNSPYQLLALENACLLYAQQEGRKLVEALSKPCTCYHAGYLSSHQYMCPQLKALASWKARNQ